MPRSRSSQFRVESHHTRTAEKFLCEKHGLTHLRVRHRADLLTIESGSKADRRPHARLRRVGVHRWQLEMATHTGRWQPTPIRASHEDLLEILVHEFGWTLALL